MIAGPDDDGARLAIAVATVCDDAGLRDRVAVALDGLGPCVRRVSPGDADVTITDRDGAGLAAAIVVGSRGRIDAAVRRGAGGGLLTGFSPAQLRITIEAVAHGLQCVPRGRTVADALDGPSAARTVEPQPTAWPHLTAREEDVLAVLITGASNKVIARQLEISVHTVKFHVAAVIGKLGAGGRTDAVARALRWPSAML